jgi:peptidoglycan/LPS O-acetylase OafA/YrhL
MCYSLYLIHWLVAVILGHLLLQAGVHGLVPVLTITGPIIFVVSIVAAWAFYMLVERHFLNTANLTAADLAPAKSAAAASPIPA